MSTATAARPAGAGSAASAANGSDQPGTPRVVPGPREVALALGQAHTIQHGRLRVDVDPGSFAEPVTLQLRRLAPPKPPAPATAVTPVTPVTLVTPGAPAARAAQPPAAGRAGAGPAAVNTPSAPRDLSVPRVGDLDGPPRLDVPVVQEDGQPVLPAPPAPNLLRLPFVFQIDAYADGATAPGDAAGRPGQGAAAPGGGAAPAVPGAPGAVPAAASGAAAAGRKVHQLARPVTFTVDFSDLAPDEWGGGYVTLYHFDEAAHDWQPVPPAQVKTDMASRRLVATVDHFSTYGVGSDSALKPSPPASLEGFQTDLATGYASASIPLFVPPGLNGMTPPLALRYSSGIAETINTYLLQATEGAPGQAVNYYDNMRTLYQASPIGLGWALDLGQIQRVYTGSVSGVPQFKYVLLLGGRSMALLDVGTDGEGNPVYRAELDEIYRVTRHPVGMEWWRVEGKDGSLYTFGGTPDSQHQAAPQTYGDGVARSWAWSLSDARDSHQNSFQITYTEDTATATDGSTYDQSVVPAEIRYGGNPTQTFWHNRKVVFDTVYNRCDAKLEPSWYAQYVGRRQITGIRMLVDVAPNSGSYQLAREYLFGQDCNVNTPWWDESSEKVNPDGPSAQVQGLPKLLLRTITERDASANALPVTTFTYPQGSSGDPVGKKLQLATAANGYGGVTTYSYQRHSPNGWYRMKYRSRVATQITQSGTGTPTFAGAKSTTLTRSFTYGTSYNGTNAVETQNYDYRGHDLVTVTNSGGATGENTFEKHYFLTRDDITANGLWYGSGSVYYLQSRQYKVEYFADGAAGTTDWTGKEETDWGYDATLGNARFIHPTESRTYRKTAAGGEAGRKTRYVSFDGNGNSTRVDEFDSLTATQWVRSVRRTFMAFTGPYVPNRVNYIVDRASTEAVWAWNTQTSSEQRVRLTHFHYDNSTAVGSGLGNANYGNDASARGRLTALRQVDPASGVQSIDTTYVYDLYGNRTSESSYTAYGTTAGPTFTVGAGTALTTTISYASPYSTYPYQITNPIGQVETRAYDVKKGVLTQVTTPNGAVNDYGFDGFGRLLSVQGPTASGPGGSYRPTTQYTYSSPVTTNGRTTTALTVQQRVDQGGATPAWQTSWRFYDGLGRVIQSYAETEGGANAVNVANTYFDTRGLAWRTGVSHAGTGSGAFLEADWAGDAGADTRTVFDTLRRPTRITTPGNRVTTTTYDGLARDVVDPNGHKQRYEDDGLGRLLAVKEYSGTDPTWTLYATTTYAYDATDQLTRVTDHLGNVTNVTYDGYGRKTQLDDRDAGLWTYEYDALSRLSRQKDAKGQYLLFSYDKLGRTTDTYGSLPSAPSDQHIGAGELMALRAAVDAERAAAGLGTGIYADATLNDTVKIRDDHFLDLRTALQGLWTARSLGTLPEFTAGALSASRQAKVSDLSDVRKWLWQAQHVGETAPSTAVAWTYHAASRYDEGGAVANALGRRTSAADASGKTAWSYDAAGRVTTLAQTILGSAYSTSTQYDAANRVVRLTYPDGEVVSTTYGKHGLPVSLAGTSSYVSAATYTALLQPLGLTYGSGGTASFDYYDTAGETDRDGVAQAQDYRLKQLKYATPPGQGGATLQQHDYRYDADGNVTRWWQQDQAGTVRRWDLVYDHLDRLTSASLGAGTPPAGQPSSFSYTYNELGNITSGPLGTYSYNASGATSTRPHAANSAGSNTYAHDANGSVLSRLESGVSYSHGYDPRGQQTSVTVSGQTTRFSFDGDGQLAAKVGPDGRATHFVAGGLFEKVPSTGAWRKYYRFGGRLVAERDSAAGLTFLHQDHLGSTSLQTSSTGGSQGQQVRGPFGQPWLGEGTLNPLSNPATDLAYTGQRSFEASLGSLLHYGATWYSPLLGRFLSPDTLVPNPGNPQHLNRYSYVRNNPLRYTDPTGHAAASSQMGDKREDNGEVWYGAFQHFEWGTVFVPYEPRLPAVEGDSWAPRDATSGVLLPDAGTAHHLSGQGAYRSSWCLISSPVCVSWQFPWARDGKDEQTKGPVPNRMKVELQAQMHGRTDPNRSYGATIDELSSQGVTGAQVIAAANLLVDLYLPHRYLAQAAALINGPITTRLDQWIANGGVQGYSQRVGPTAPNNEINRRRGINEPAWRIDILNISGHNLKSW